MYTPKVLIKNTTWFPNLHQHLIVLFLLNEF